MAKPLVFSLGGAEYPLALSRVERSDLYGFVEVETYDEAGNRCVTATLADDGRSVILSGGTALASLSPDGNWLDRKSLVPTDNQGERIVPVASSYAAPVPLDTRVTIDEYLSYDVRAVYEVAGSDGMDLGPLMAELKDGAIFQFPYSFRGGLEPDVGFLLLAADGTPFLAIGTPTKLEFVGLEQGGGIAEDEEGEEESLDFGMM